MITMERVTVFVAAFLVLAGCGGGHEKYMQQQAERTARLHEAYPVGLARAEVHARLKADAHGTEQVPVLSGVRPATGWLAVPQVPGGNWCARAEERTGKAVASFERYSMVDGFLSLCYYWFYFDEADALVDVEWQYQSD